MKETGAELDERETSVLHHARSGFAPPSARRRAILSGVASGIAAEAPTKVPSGDAPPPAESGAAETAASLSNPPLLPQAASVAGPMVQLKWVVAGLVSASAAGFGAGYFTAATSHPSSAPAAMVESSRSREKSVLPSPSQQEPSSVEAVFLDVDAPAEAPPPPPLAKASASRGPQRPDPPQQDEAKPTFYQELSYIRRAQSALQQNNAVLALGLMTSLDEIQPSGALLVERNVTKVLALCRLERTDEAVAIALETLQSKAVELYKRRLAGSCAKDAFGAIDPEASGDESTALTDPIEGEPASADAVRSDP